MLADINNKTLLCNRKLISSETNPGLDPKKVRKVPVCVGFSSLVLCWRTLEFSGTWSLTPNPQQWDQLLPAGINPEEDHPAVGEGLQPERPRCNRMCSDSPVIIYLRQVLELT